MNFRRRKPKKVEEVRKAEKPKVETKKEVKPKKKKGD